MRTSVVVALLFVIAPVGVAANASTSSGAAHGAVIAASDTTIPDEAITDSTAVWRIENDPSACINSNPRPNCGYKPTDAGERGGALQVSLFFIMLGAIAVIGTVIFRNIVKRDRAIAADLARRESSTDR